jgi:PAS domain S-box-containing protein/putative nucleotidyltransferase with HDIG domain
MPEKTAKNLLVALQDPHTRLAEAERKSRPPRLAPEDPQALAAVPSAQGSGPPVSPPQQQLQLLQALLEALPDPIFYKTREGVFLGCNQAFAHLVGLSQEELLGRTAADLSPRPPIRTQRKKDPKLLSREKAQEFEAFSVFAGGRRKRVISRLTPCRGMNGLPPGFIGTVIDTDKQAAAAKASLAAFSVPGSELEPALKALEEVWFRGLAPKAPVPCQPELQARLSRFLNEMLPVQEFAAALAKGDLSQSLESKGIMAGGLKSLQASLRHLAWQTKKIGKGDFSQRVDFMGEFSESFNTMIRRLEEDREQEVAQNLIKFQIIMIQTVEAIASMAEMRDPYTAGHQRNVTRLACALASKVGLTDDRIEGIRIGGFLHDIGKLVIPAEILNRPGKLNEYELRLIRTHPQAGYDILQKIDFPWPVAQIVLQHHERLNGSGYPQGLQGPDILKEAKILAVSDVVEAMAAHRPYRPGLGVDKALEEITANQGTLYDPQIVEACVQLFEKNEFQF